MHNLLAASFPGAIYPVNPGRESCYGSEGLSVDIFPSGNSRTCGYRHAGADSSGSDRGVRCQSKYPLP